MKNLGRYSLFIFVTLIVVGAVFSAGYYVGNGDDVSKYKFEANAGEPVDMTAFWKVWYLLEDRYVVTDEESKITDEEKLWGAISGLVRSYGDPYTVFFPPVENEQFQESIDGNFEGVGMEVSLRDGLITVVAPLKNTPAERAGIKAGDIILKIDDVNALGLSLDEAIEYIRGPRGSEVVITVGREGQDEPLPITVTREVIEIPTIDTELRSDGIFVISLYNFNSNATRLFRDALREFVSSGSDKMILDMRNNPGGFLDAAIDISSWFLPTGKVIVKENFGGDIEEKVFRSKGYQIFNDEFELVVLMDGGSASASEIVAGALGEHDVATLVGTQTFGKGSVQELIDITGSTSLKVTIARWLTPEGVSISEGGLAPDVVVENVDDDVEGAVEGVDEQLEKAVEILKGK